MGLLNDLRAASPAEDEEHPWLAAKRALPWLVPDLEITKMELHSDGRVGIRGRTPMGGQGRFYFVLVLDGVGTGLADGTREVKLGVARYRDEADAQIYDQPYRAWVEPTPGAVVVWMTGVLTTGNPYPVNR